MNIRWPMPRLLHLTIAVLALTLVMKSVDVVRAAAPPPPAAPAPAAAPPASPAAAPPQGDALSKTDVSKTDVSQADTPPVSAAERGLLQDLRQRRVQLDTREANIALRENVLASAEKRISTRVEELTALQTRLEGLDAERRKRDEANWASLVKVYENMKPRDAANIFNDLDMAVLLPVLDRMKEAKAAPVLAAMEADRARAVTADLARLRSRRNAIPDGAGGANPATPITTPIATPVAAPIGTP